MIIQKGYIKFQVKIFIYRERGFIVVSRSACGISLAPIMMSSCYDSNIIQINYFISLSHDKVRSTLYFFRIIVSCPLTSLTVKPVISELLKKFTTLCGNRSFKIVFTNICTLSLNLSQIILLTYQQNCFKIYLITYLLQRGTLLHGVSK